MQQYRNTCSIDLQCSFLPFIPAITRPHGAVMQGLLKQLCKILWALSHTYQFVQVSFHLWNAGHSYIEIIGMTLRPIVWIVCELSLNEFCDWLICCVTCQLPLIIGTGHFSVRYLKILSWNGSSLVVVCDQGILMKTVFCPYNPKEKAVVINMVVKIWMNVTPVFVPICAVRALPV